MADKLRPDELAAFKAAFDMFDKNQDGTISTKVSRKKDTLLYSESRGECTPRGLSKKAKVAKLSINRRLLSI